jgi:hypothetical protein
MQNFTNNIHGNTHKPHTQQQQQQQQNQKNNNTDLKKTTYADGVQKSGCSLWMVCEKKTKTCPS